MNLTSSEILNLSIPGKRLAALKKKKLQKKIQMRAELPVLTREEVIRYRLPPYKALLRAISQDGFHNTAEYMDQLVDYQEYVRNMYGPDTNIWIRPRLMENMDILNHLKEGLSKAEKAHMADNIVGEVTEILKLAVDYAFGEENWWWLGHQLIDQTITISKEYTKDGHMSHATARYILGKFLLEQITDLEAALEHLNIARTLSVGTSWNARHILKKFQNSVFSEVSVLLYAVFLKQAKRTMKTDTRYAIRLCEMARRAALDGCFYPGQTEAYLLKGQCEQFLFDTASAISSFQKALAIQSAHEDPKWKCETLANLGVAYLKHGYFSSALKMFHSLKDYAHDRKELFYVAQAYKYLGEYYLREGTSQNATPLLKIALKLFNEGNYIKEAESTRNYAAISIGIELINYYIRLIVQCVPENPDFEACMKKLVDWKDSRVSFWEEDSDMKNIYEMDDEDQVLYNLKHQNEKMQSKEVVLSVLSLVDSEESDRPVYNSLRRKSKETTRMHLEEINKENSRLQTNDNKKKIFENEEDVPAEKKIVTLHVAENFEENEP